MGRTLKIQRKTLNYCGDGRAVGDFLIGVLLQVLIEYAVFLCELTIGIILWV